jgi:hypothetical protein
MILKVSSLSHLQTMVPLVTHSWQMWNLVTSSKLIFEYNLHV